MSATKPYVMVDLDCHAETDSIIIGYQIGSAETEHGTLTVLGSGKKIRFTLGGHDGYVDLDLSEAAGAAHEWLSHPSRARA